MELQELMSNFKEIGPTQQSNNNKKKRQKNLHHNQQQKKGSNHLTQNQQQSKISKYKKRAIAKIEKQKWNQFHNFKQTFSDEIEKHNHFLFIIIFFFIVVYFLVTNLLTLIIKSVTKSQWINYIISSCISIFVILILYLSKKRVARNNRSFANFSQQLHQKIKKSIFFKVNMNDFISFIFSCGIMILTMVFAVKQKNYFFSETNFQQFIASSFMWVFFFVSWNFISRLMIKFISLIIVFITLIYIVIKNMTLTNNEIDSKVLEIYKIILILCLCLLIIIKFALIEEKQMKNYYEIFKNQNKIDENWKIMVSSMPLGVVIISYTREMLYLNQKASDILGISQLELNDNKNIQIQKYYEMVSRLGSMEEFEKNDQKLYIKAVQKQKDTKEEKKKPAQSKEKMKKEHIGLLKGLFNLDQILMLMIKEDIYDINDRQYKCTKYFNSNFKNSNLNQVYFNQNLTEEQEDIMPEISINIQEEMSKEEEFEAANQPKYVATQKYQEAELQISSNFNFEDQKSFMIIIEDITQKKILLNLAEDQESKKRILMSFANLIRAPLKGTVSSLDSCISDPRMPNEIKQIYLEQVSQGMKLLSYTVDAMVDYALMQTDQFFIKIESFDLRDFIYGIFKLFKTQAKQKNIKLHKEIEKSLPGIIQNDKRRLAQILINLLGNAIKFTQRGVITLKVSWMSKKKQIIMFGLLDSGQGMDQNTLDILNDHFLKTELHEESQIAKTGVGLGLQICHNLSKWLGPQLNGKLSGMHVISKFNQGSYFGFLVQNHVNSEDAPQELQKQKVRFKRDDDENSMTSLEPSSNEEEEMNQILEAARISIIDYNSEKSISNSSSIEQINLESQKQFENTYQSQFNLQQINSPTQSSPKQKSDDQNDLNSQQQLSNQIKEPVQCLSCKQVLSVDDDLFNQLQLETILNMFKLKIQKAFNGKQAIEIVKNYFINRSPCYMGCQGFKLIFMDYKMPIMDGCQAAQQLRQMMDENLIPEIPIIAIIDHGNYEDCQKCIEVGMIEQISYPIDQLKIKDILNKYYYIDQPFTYDSLQK